MTTRNWLTTVSAGVTCVAGGVVVVGTLSPWFRFSFLGVNADIKGTSQFLDGRYALALGITAIVLGAITVALGPRHVATVPAGVVLVAVGIAGIAVMRHQGRHLTTAQALLQARGFGKIDALFAAQTSPTWGFWLSLSGFVALIVAAAATVLIGRGQSGAVAPPASAAAQPSEMESAHPSDHPLDHPSEQPQGAAIDGDHTAS